MEHLGKKLIRYGEHEVVADVYAMPIDNDLWADLLSVASKEQLEGIMNEQVGFENFEAASDVKKELENRA